MNTSKRKLCVGTRKDGKPCKQRVRNDGDYCRHHREVESIPTMVLVKLEIESDAYPNVVNHRLADPERRKALEWHIADVLIRLLTGDGWEGSVKVAVLGATGEDAPAF